MCLIKVKKDIDDLLAKDSKWFVSVSTFLPKCHGANC